LEPFQPEGFDCLAAWVLSPGGKLSASFAIHPSPFTWSRALQISNRIISNGILSIENK
jgi:hypothetical protein